MRARLPFLIAAGVVFTGLSGAYLFNGLAHGEWDPTQLEQQVQSNTEQLQNHETRITNLETNSGITPSPLASPTQVAPVATQTATTVQATSTAAAAASSPSPSPTPSIAMWHENYDGCGNFINYRLDWSDGSQTYSANQPTSGNKGNPLGGYGSSCYSTSNEL